MSKRRLKQTSAILWLVGVLIGTTMALGATSATAQVVEVQHGISFTKGCSSPTAIGAPYTCSFSVQNNVDEAHDTLTINGLVDTVQCAPSAACPGGTVSSGNVFSSLKLDNCSGPGPVCTQTTATCTGTLLTGTGTRADPWQNAQSCTLPFGSRINVESFSHYTVQEADFGLPGHILQDSASLNWNDLCNDPAGTGNTNCNPNPPPNVGATSESLLTPLTSSTATTIHDAAHNPVTAVAVGSTVHDLVTVTGQAGHSAPTGNVNVDWFLNGTCTGPPQSNSGSIGPLVAGGGFVSTFDATGFAFGPLNTAGLFAFKGHYEGAGPYAASVGACEPLNVVDANIQITPAMATNPVGTNHTLHCHINVNDGTGFVNAPDGTTCTVTVISGAATPVSQNCSTGTPTAGSGTCDVVITSSTAGTNTIQASTTVTVGGVSLTRTTGDAHVGDGPNATKLFGDVTVTTKVLDNQNNDITGTTVNAGTVVHDQATVTRTAGTPAGVPNPTGSVTFTLYSGTGCSGTVLATDANEPLGAGGVATSATFTTPATAGSFSYLAHYNGDANYPAKDAGCEPFQTQAKAFAPALTPGFWKNHEAATTALLPISLGNYVVDTFAKASAIFDAMKCSSPIDCLAGHLLAAKLDLASGSNPSITPVIAQADALLIAVNYNGPGNFTPPTAAQKALALQLEALIDAYTNQ
jgi:hypothetical protein